MNRKERDLDEQEGRETCTFMFLGFRVFRWLYVLLLQQLLSLDPARALACLHVYIILRCTGKECCVGRSGALLCPRCLDFTNVCCYRRGIIDCVVPRQIRLPNFLA